MDKDVKMKPRLLITIGFFASLSWIGYLFSGLGGEVMVDGITVSAIVVTGLSVVFSILSWFLFSLRPKNLSVQGIMISVITGVAIITPFKGVFGPMAGILVGIVGGFAAYMIGKLVK